MPKYIQPQQPLAHNVRAICTTRTGGVSEGVYSGFNLGLHVGDRREKVEHNRKQLCQDLELTAEPSWLNQVHGVEIVDAQSLDQNNVDADGVYSDSHGQVCAVMTADCMPILMCDDAGERIMAVHAGWRGIAAGIVERAVSLFDVVPSKLNVWLGPSISSMHFEIGEEVPPLLGGPIAAYRESDTKGKYYACLNTIVHHRLGEKGVANIQGGEHCTYANEKDFYSYRRDGQCGRMASLIWRVK